MVHAAILTFAALAGTPADLPIPESEWKTYQAAKAEAQRNPEAHIKLALWCEQHGLDAERLKHLAIASLVAPKNATARGLLGVVNFKGQWRRPEAVTEQVQNDQELAAKLAEYNDRRAKAANTADGQWQLALWCEQHGLKAEATAHLASVVRLDPGREEAWKRLGFKKHDGRWMTDEQLAAEKADRVAQKKADHYWEPRLEKWKAWLADQSRKQEAEARLADVSDSRAVPSLWKVFVQDSPNPVRGVQLLGQVDAAAAGQALAYLAVFGPSDESRRAARETLRQRPPGEYVPIIIGLMKPPIKYEVKHVGGPGSPGTLLIDGKQARLKRIYSPPLPPRRLLSGKPYVPVLAPNEILDHDALGMPIFRKYSFNMFGEPVGSLVTDDMIRAMGGDPYIRFAPMWIQTPSPFMTDLFSQPAQAASILKHAQTHAPGMVPSSPTNTGHVGLVPVYRPDLAYWRNGTSTKEVGRMVLETQRAAVSAEEQLQEDIGTLEHYNKKAGAWNSQLGALLAELTDEKVDSNIAAWQKWWIDQLGYNARPYDPQSKRTVVEQVDLRYQLPNLIGFLASPTGYFAESCFGAGTMVRTLTGSRAIETLNIGDEVLSQDTKSGALSYQPILVVHHNPPSKTFLIRLGDETIVSSPFHRFWKAGKGWVMARDLQEGDVIRTLAGLQKVSSKQDGPVQPVFNLDVAETASFFVGKDGALVHDNTLPSPELQPFDAEPVLTASKTAAP